MLREMKELIGSKELSTLGKKKKICFQQLSSMIGLELL
jgi:hypothetical protein